MHLLVVAPHLSLSHVGGVEVYTQTLSEAMAARGHDVEAVGVERLDSGSVASCASTSSMSAGVHLHRLALTVTSNLVFSLMAVESALTGWFDRHLRASRPDLVHVQSGYLTGASALEAARRHGIPTVLTLHDYWFACPRVILQHPDGQVCDGPERPAKCAWCLTADGRLHRALDTVTRGALSRNRDRSAWWPLLDAGRTDAVAARQREVLALLSSADAVLAPTSFVADRVAEIGFPRDRIRLSRCGIESQPARPPTRGEGLRLAYVGQVAPHKGVHLIVEALQTLSDRPITLDVHGPLGAHPAYVASVRRLVGNDPRVRFHGPYRREALPEIFSTADAVVVPSVWHEVAALVIQEAQAAGVPVIASAMGGSPELVTDGVDGLLFDLAEPGALAGRLARLLDDPDLLRRLRAAAPRPRSTGEEVDALLALYHDVRRS